MCIYIYIVGRSFALVQANKGEIFTGARRAGVGVNESPAFGSSKDRRGSGGSVRALGERRAGPMWEARRRGLGREALRRAWSDYFNMTLCRAWCVCNENQGKVSQNNEG